MDLKKTSSSNYRRKSVYTSSRRKSNTHENEEFIVAFLANRGVTIQDVEYAFSVLSKDGKKVGRDDIKSFAETFFNQQKLSQKQLKFLFSFKEDLTFESLSNILLNRPMGSTPFEDAFDVK